MFDNTQRTEINNIDERVFPDGLTVLWKLARFAGKCGAFTPKEETLDYLGLLVKKFDETSIPIIKIGEDPYYWFVRVEGIKL